MKTRQIDRGYLISIEPGEEIVSTLLDFVQKNDIGSGTVTAIGAVSAVELGYYELAEKQYHWKNFAGTIEIVSAIGNISWLADQPVVHLHGVFSGTDFSTFAGHVRNATVSAACEITFMEHNTRLLRRFDDATELNLWDV